MENKISIIIPTYNRAHLISETLISISNQTFANWECIIVDDKSNDNTIKIVESFLLDSRFKFFVRSDAHRKGANSCRNIGLEKSTGNLILWFDSDDILIPKALEVCVEFFNNSAIDFCRFEREIFYNEFKNDDKEILKNIDVINLDVTDLDKILMNEIPMGTCNVIWNKSAIANERFNTEITYADEWEFFSRLISNKLNGISINVVLLYVRKHINSTTFEFRNNNLNRVNSKKKAICLVSENLVNKGLFSIGLLKYLSGYAISFRDKELLNTIFDISDAKFKDKILLSLKFYLYPTWLIYKRLLKKYL